MVSRISIEIFPPDHSLLDLLRIEAIDGRGHEE